MAAAPLSRTRACSARAEPPLQLDTDDHESDAIQLLLAIAAESDAMSAIEDGEPTSEEEDSSEEKEGSWGESALRAKQRRELEADRNPPHAIQDIVKHNEEMLQFADVAFHDEFVCSLTLHFKS